MTARDDHRRPTGADLAADQLRLGDLGHGCVDAGIKLLLPAPRPRERLDQRAIRLRLCPGTILLPSGATMRLRPPRRWKHIGMRTTSMLPSSSVWTLEAKVG